MTADTFLDLKFQEKRFYGLVQRLPSSEQAFVQKAYRIAAAAHQGQARIEGQPYIIHPLRMVNFLMTELEVKDKDVLASTLLHDVVEDTNLGLSEVKNEFGAEVKRLVKTLTREADYQNETERQRFRNKQKKLQEILKADCMTRTIKCVDWFDNMCSWSHIPPNHPFTYKFERWLKEAKTMYIPLAEKTNQMIAAKMEIALKRAQQHCRQTLGREASRINQ